MSQMTRKELLEEKLRTLEELLKEKETTIVGVDVGDGPAQTNILTIHTHQNSAQSCAVTAQRKTGKVSA